MNKPEKRGRGRPPTGDAPRVAISIKLDPEVLTRVRRAAHGSGWTVTQILEDGAQHVVRRLEKQFNHGRPFPPAPRESAKK